MAEDALETPEPTLSLATETPPTPPTPEPTPNATPPATPETTDDEEGGLLGYIKENFDLDLTSKYKDPDEALRGLAEAYRKVGERNEEAQRFKQIQQAIAGREAEFAAFLQGQTPQPAAPTNGSDDWMSGVTPEQVRTWQALVDAKQATPEITQKLAKVQERVYATMLDLAFRSDKALSPHIEAKTKELETRLQQMAQTEQERFHQQAIQTWANSHADVLYAPDGSDSSVGQLTRRLYAEDLAEIPDPVKRADMALRIAMAQQPRTPTAKTIPLKAKHQPAVAPPEKKTISPEEFFAKGGTLADYMKQAQTVADDE